MTINENSKIRFFSDTDYKGKYLKINYNIKDNSLLLEWSINKNINYKKSSFRESIVLGIGNMGDLEYSEDRKEVIFNGLFSIISIETNYFKNMTKDFFNKYVKQSKEIQDKYIKPYNLISKKHQKLIEDNSKFKKVIENYAYGYLMFSKKEELIEDEDKFFSKFDFFSKGLRTKGINQTILEMLRIFPKTTKEITVWRAIRFDKPSKKGDIIKQDIVFSTSLNPYVSLDFMDSCCLFKITLPPRYPVIFLNKFLEWQDEVILGPAEIKVKKMHIVKKAGINKFLKDPIFPHLRTYGLGMKRSKKDFYIYDCSIKPLEN